MSTPSLKPKPSFCFTSFPAKRSAETEEQFNQRVLEFLADIKIHINNFYLRLLYSKC